MENKTLATVPNRILGYLLDAFVVSIPLSFLFLSLFGAEKASMYSTKYGSMIFLAYLMISLVLWTGKTVGKNVVHVKVMKMDGSEVDYWTVIKRYVIATVVYAFTFGIGMWVSLFMMIFRKDKRTIHDLIAGTVVIRN